jgi:hypothetical protein
MRGATAITVMKAKSEATVCGNSKAKVAGSPRLASSAAFRRVAMAAASWWVLVEIETAVD